jgi:hypothetical protein
MRILIVPPKALGYVIGVTAPCLDETRALAFVAGELPVAQRDGVEAHIDDCDSCRQVLAALVRQASGSAPTEAAAAAAAAVAHAIGGTWADGTRVGRYIVRGKLGRGGMGSVYRAEDPELARPVALKRLHAAPDAETRARLVREARAAAQLAHPNVLAVYEVGVAGSGADNIPYIAMELVDGVTLTAWLGEPRTWREIVAMFAQAGRGLVAAHERGLVHRDFKPDNVLVDRSGRARVADFGLARMWDGDTRDLDSGATHDAALARMTATGALSGTPAYMAPELVDGAAPNAASDQFAFAVALHEALRGQHPFAGTTPGALWAEMAAGRVRAGGRKIPAWLDRVVRRGLAVEPALRWPSIGSFVEALERPPRRMWPWLAGAGAVAVASLVVAIVALFAARAPAEPPLAPGDMQYPGVGQMKVLMQSAVLAGVDGDHARALGIAEAGLVVEPANAWALQVVASESCALGDYARGRALEPRLPQAMRETVHRQCTPPPAEPAPPPPVATVAPVAPAGAPAKTAKGKPAPIAKTDIKAVLKEAGFAGMNGEYDRALELAQGVLATDPNNQWALQLVVYSACSIRWDLVQDKGDAKEIAKYEQLALSTNRFLEAKTRGLIHSECDRAGIWLEGDIEEVGTHKQWHAGPTPPPKSPPPARIVLNNIALDYTSDPAASLAQVEDVLAKEPTNAQGLRLGTVVACELDHHLKLHGGSAGDIADAERKARAFADKLTPHDRWLVWSECQRWSGIWLEGDVDKLGDGHIEHIGPKPPK